MQGSPSDVLEVKNLSVSTRRHGENLSILSGIDLKVKASEIVGVVGESGSGKSTLARAVTRLLPEVMIVNSGSILLRGQDILRARASTVHRIRPGGVSMVFQSPLNALNPLLPIGHQVAEAFRYLEGVTRRQALDRSVEILERMGIRDASRRLAAYPHEFSGGQRQRIVIAIALAGKPAVLIADEPTSALDVTTQAAILEMFVEIARENATAIIFVSHNYAVVSTLCSRVLVLYAGRLMEVGRADRLLTDPRHPYTAALIDSLPSIDRRANTLQVIPGSPPRLGEITQGCPFHPRCRHAQDRCLTASMELHEVGRDHASACVRVSELWDGPSDATQSSTQIDDRN